MPIALALACPGCGRSVETPLDPSRPEVACPHCGRMTPLPEAAALNPGGLPTACVVCGCADLYVQRDFNRALGLGIAGVGLVLGPFTSWVSTVVAIAIDALLYVTVPLVAVCYACNAQYRGFEREAAPEAFDIAVHDAYKFGKRFPPRREVAVAGPLAKRLAFEGPAPTPPPAPPAP